METVAIIFNGNECVIPKADLKFFLEEKGAKLVKEEKATAPKKVSKKNNKK